MEEYPDPLLEGLNTELLPTAGDLPLLFWEDGAVTFFLFFAP